MESTSYFTETDDCCSSYTETTCDTFISQRINRKNSRQRDIRELEDMSQSTSSGSDATVVHCLTVYIVLNDENFLGLHIYANIIDGIDEGIYVDGVTENSAVALNGNIEPGDKLIQVNDVNLEELSNEEAIGVLKAAVIKRGPLKLVVAKFVESSKKVDVMGPKDAIYPIDTAAWVAHAQLQANTLPNIANQDDSRTSSPSFGSSAGMRLNRDTVDIGDIIEHMKVGLKIKDREWLKIIIPQAFLGSELVTWLKRNVYGFSNRGAKKFAAKLLDEGYIRDPIAKKPFSSKSYYTFVAT